MIEQLALGPADRVLFVSVPAVDLVVELARRLERGVVVGLGDPEEIAGARRATRELVNVMFQPGCAEEIPWSNGFFSRVIDLCGGWRNPGLAAREVARVLVPGGRAYLANVDAAVLAEAGLVEVGAAAGLLVVEKPC